MSKSLLDIEFKSVKGETKTLKDFSAKMYLVVNTASKCGLTPQYEALQAVYGEYHAKGLEIIAFPANEFLGQEPGSDNEIQEFCRLTYNVSFPVMSKIIVKGEGQHELYRELITQKPEAVKDPESDFEERLKSKGLLTGEPKDIHWNFEKFLVDADGNIVERYFPDIAPNDERITTKIESLLG